MLASCPIQSSVVFNTLFGLSAKYWMAIATRFLLGALNGFLAPAKVAIEVCPPDQIPAAEHLSLSLSLVANEHCCLLLCCYVQAYSIEVCRPEQQALGISVVSTAWGMGVIIGPAIGGYLAQVHHHLFVSHLD